MTLKSDMQKPEPFLNPKALSAKARTRKPFNPKPPLLGVPGLASAVEWMVVPGQSCCSVGSYSGPGVEGGGLWLGICFFGLGCSEFGGFDIEGLGFVLGLGLYGFRIVGFGFQGLGFRMLSGAQLC